jgi:hypothetical protein
MNSILTILFAAQPDRPKVCHFWLLALLSSFNPRSGSNEEGLQVAMLHLARFVFYYTGHAVPACLRARLAFETEVHRVRLELLTLILTAPLALKVGPPEDRIGIFCTEAANQVLRYVLQQDEKLLEASVSDMRIDVHDARREDTLRWHLSEALHMGHSSAAEHRGAIRQPETSVRSVAKIVVATALRGVGLPSTAFGWRVASAECLRLLSAWMNKSWWRLTNFHNVLVTVDTAPIGAKVGVEATRTLPRHVLALYGRSGSYDVAPGKSRGIRCVVGQQGCPNITTLLHALDPLLPEGEAGAQVLSMDLFPPELWMWYVFVYQAARVGKPWGFLTAEAGFVQEVGGALERLLDRFMAGDDMYDLWHVRARHILDVCRPK